MKKILKLALMLLCATAAAADEKFKPEPQIYHRFKLMGIECFSDGKTFVTTDQYTIKIWDLKSFKILKTLAFKNTISSFALSPDSSRIAVCSEGYYIYNRKSGGMKYYTCEGDGRPTCQGITYSASGKKIGLVYLYANQEFNYDTSGKKTGVVSRFGSQESEFKLIDAESGKILNSVKIEAGKYKGWKISPDLSFIGAVMADSAKTIALISTDDGKIIRKIEASTTSVDSICFSPDSSCIASSGSGNDKNINIWEISSGRNIHVIPPQSGRRKWNNSIYYYGGSGSIAFSRDGKYVVSNNGLYELKGMTKLEFSGSEPYAFTPDSAKVVINGFYDNVKLWDIRLKMSVNSSKSINEVLNNFSWSSDGKYIVTTGNMNGIATGIVGEGSCLKLWDVTFGRYVRYYSDSSEAAFNPVNKKFTTLSATGTKSGDAVLMEYSADNSREAKKLACDYTGGMLTYNSDGCYLAMGVSKGKIVIWNIKTKKLLSIIDSGENDIHSVSWSPDSKMIAAGFRISGTGSDRYVACYNVETGKEKWSLKSNLSSDNSVAFSPDGKVLYVMNYEYGLSALNPSDGSNIRLYELPSGKTYPFDPHVAVSPDGRTVASSASDYSIVLWDTATGDVRSVLSGHTQTVEDFSFSPAGGLFASLSSIEGVLRVWNCNTGKSVCMKSSGTDNWITYTDDGYFDASVSGGELVAMTTPETGFGIDQFALKNNRPDIIMELIGIASKNAIDHYHEQYLKRLRKSGLTDSDLSGEIHAPETTIIESKQDNGNLTLKFEVKDSRYKITKYNVFVNDVPIFGSKGKEIRTKGEIVIEQVSLTPGTNKIEASCINEKGAESFRALSFAEYKSPAKGDLYYLGFGVSRYSDSSLNLKYADKDAEDLAAMYSGMKGRYSSIYVKTFLNEEVTVENISKAKEFLTNAKPEDTFVLFIAGHGVHDTDKEATYYYLTHNADRNDLEGSCANFELVENILQGIAPRNKLFLMDTCESGEVEDAVQNKYYSTANSRGIKARTARSLTVVPKGGAKREAREYIHQKDRYIYNDLSRRSGAIVFSSSKGGEFSYESDKIKNGYFTKEIISATKSGSADKNRDGIVSTDELREYVAKSVAKSTGDLQHPTVDRDNLYQKFGFPVK